MLTRKIDMERLTLVSSKPFDAVVSVVEQSIGRPDIAEIGRAASDSISFSEFERTVSRGVSALGLMLFMKLDVGAVLRKESGLSSPRAVRFLIGNPLIMKEMAKHVPEAASYAPITLLVDERSDGVQVMTRWQVSLRLSHGEHWLEVTPALQPPTANACEMARWASSWICRRCCALRKLSA